MRCRAFVRGTLLALPPVMLAAASLPLLVLVAALVVITHGSWPTGLGPTLAIVTVVGGITVALMDRLLDARS